MTKKGEHKGRGRTETATYRAAHQVRLPGFVIDEQIGLGDALERVTSYIGLRPCDGCKRRAAALNRWMVFNK